MNSLKKILVEDSRHRQSHYSSHVSSVGEEVSECFSCPSIVDYRETEAGDTEFTFTHQKNMKDLEYLQTELLKLKLRKVEQEKKQEKEWDIVTDFIGPELSLFYRECEVRPDRAD